jgi:putative ABC transport system ATP-binding protein
VSLLSATAVVKDYHGLRPLRIEAFSLDAGEHAALVGLDAPAAEVFVNLLTGAALPDHGDIVAFGRSTRAIEGSEAWLALVDRFGIVTDRAVLIEALSVVQNLAMPFSLDVEPPSDDIRTKATAIAREVGLPATKWDCRVAVLGPSARVRVRLGRALALDPAVVLLEHPTASVPQNEVGALARDLRRILDERAVAALTLTTDAAFADSVAPRVFTLDPATGRLRERRRLFRR